MKKKLEFWKSAGCLCWRVVDANGVTLDEGAALDHRGNVKVCGPVFNNPKIVVTEVFHPGIAPKYAVVGKVYLVAYLPGWKPQLPTPGDFAMATSYGWFFLRDGRQAAEPERAWIVKWHLEEDG